MTSSLYLICLGLCLGLLLGRGAASYQSPIQRPAPCKELSQTCEPCRCGVSTCTIVEECRYCDVDKSLKDHPRMKPLMKSCETPIRRRITMSKPCCHARCENGATTLVPGGKVFGGFRGKRSARPQFVRIPICRFFFRFPKCACSDGYEGQCCEKVISGNQPLIIIII